MSRIKAVIAVSKAIRSCYGPGFISVSVRLVDDAVFFGNVSVTFSDNKKAVTIAVLFDKIKPADEAYEVITA